MKRTVRLLALEVALVLAGLCACLAIYHLT